MTVSKKLVAGGVGIAAVAALGTWAVADLTDDPDEDLSTISLGAVPTASGTATVPASVTETLSGTVERVGLDVDDLAIGRIELDFGPDEWVASAEGIEDYDGDGDVEAVRDELEGLEGQDVELLVSYDEDGDRDDADVHEINGLAIGVPSTSGGAEATPEEVARAAEAEVGAGSRAVDVERDDDSDVLIWEAEVIDTDGREHTVVLNAAGEVLGAEADD